MISDKKFNESLEFYDANYKHLRIPFSQYTKDVYWNVPENVIARCCIYCNKVESDSTKFETRSHLLQEALGNRHLLDYFQCDNCNSFFKIHDSDLGNFTALQRCLGRMKGKSRHPISFANQTPGFGKFKIRQTEDGYAIDESSPGAIHISDNKVSIDCYRSNYVPVNVYKAFLRVALGLIPSEDALYFEESRKWLMSVDQSMKLSGIKPLFCFETFYPNFSHKNPEIFLFLRKKDCNVPFCTLYVSFGSASYQIFVPSVQDLHLRSTSVTAFVLPQLKQMKEWFTQSVNLESWERETKSFINLAFQFQEMTGG